VAGWPERSCGNRLLCYITAATDCWRGYGAIALSEERCGHFGFFKSAAASGGSLATGAVLAGTLLIAAGGVAFRPQSLRR